MPPGFAGLGGFRGLAQRTDDWKPDHSRVVWDKEGGAYENSLSMLRENIVDLMSFIMVARESSFTRAAKRIGVSQSALSHSVRGLEERLGVQLLHRTTRSVTPTRPGEQVLDRLEPHFSEMELELSRILEGQDRPAGTIRIGASHYAETAILWPKLAPVLKQYPDLRVEIAGDACKAGSGAEDVDARVCRGEQAEDRMIAVRISPDFRMLAVAAPSYLARGKRPQTPQDLTKHACINLHQAGRDDLPVWVFGKRGREVRLRVDGQTSFHTLHSVVDAAIEGYGVGHVPEGLVSEALADGRLLAVLEDWCPPVPGYFLCYPQRRKDSVTLEVLTAALCHSQQA